MSTPQFLNSFGSNIYLDMLAEQLGAYKVSCNKKKTPQKGISPFCHSAIVEEEEQEDEFHNNVSYDDSVYNKGAVVSPSAGAVAYCPSMLVQPCNGKQNLKCHLVHSCMHLAAKESHW